MKKGIGHRPRLKHKKEKFKVKTKTSQQVSFFKTDWKHRYAHGGMLRNKRAGRGARPLSTKDPLHLVFKVNKNTLRQKSLRAAQSFILTNQIIKKYSRRFFVKIEQLSIQNDHIHALIRTTRRSQYQHFFRVVSGQIAQCYQKEGLLMACVTDTLGATKLWKSRPFTRVIKGFKAYQIVRNYIQLNEKEVLGKIRYQKNRLRGLSSADWEVLWSQPASFSNLKSRA